MFNMIIVSTTLHKYTGFILNIYTRVFRRTIRNEHNIDMKVLLINVIDNNN